MEGNKIMQAMSTGKYLEKDRIRNAEIPPFSLFTNGRNTY